MGRSKKQAEKPEDTSADMPVIKAFMVRYPSAQAQSIADFHDNYRESKKVIDTVHFLAQKGDVEAMAREMRLDIAKLVKLDGVQQALSKSQNTIQLIDRTQTISADEKRQLIDTLYMNMIDIGRGGRAAMRQVEAATKAPE